MAASSCSGAFLHESLKFCSASMRKLIIYPSTAVLDPALCHEHHQTRGSWSQVTGKSSVNWGFVLLKNGRQLKMKSFVQMFFFFCFVFFTKFNSRQSGKLLSVLCSPRTISGVQGHQLHYEKLFSSPFFEMV